MRAVNTLQGLLSIAFVTLTALSTLVLAAVVSKHYGHGLKREIGYSLAQAANSIQVELDAEVVERTRDIEVLASLEEFRNTSAGTGSQRTLIDALAKTHAAYAWIGFANPAGELQAATAGLLEGADVSTRPWFQKVLQTGETVTVDVHDAKLLAALLPSPTGEPLRFFDVATSVRNTQGELLGVLGAHLSWEWARSVEADILAPLRRQKQIDTFILDRDGKVLMGPSSYIGKILELPQNEDQAVNGYRVWEWDDHKEYLAGYAQAATTSGDVGMGWTVLVRQSLDDAYAPVKRIRNQVLGWGVLLCLLLTLTGLLIARRIARPLLAISKAADEIREGGTDVRVPTSTDYREVERLADSIQSLVSSRLLADQDMRNLNQSLEQRVADRTRQLAVSEETTRAILTRLADGIITLDAEARIQMANPAFCHIFGYDINEVIGRNIRDFTPNLHVHPIDGLVCRLDRKLSSMADKHTIELLGVRRDGSPLHVAIGLTTLENVVTESRFVCVVHDVTERTMQQAHKESHDPLTGTPNRSAFERRLASLGDRKSGSSDHAILYLDLDQFKIVNDLCGRVAGDELIKSMAILLRNQLREIDSLARMVGDEFAILLPATGLDEAVRQAEAIRGSVSRFVFKWSEKTFGCTASIGVAVVGIGTEPNFSALSAAEAACCMAKEKGRNRVQAFHADEAEFAYRLGLMDWTRRLREALDEDRLHLYAQKISPVVPSTGRDGHYEILVRKKDRQGKLIPPGAFILAAERYNLMPEIDRRIITKAFAFLAQARTRGYSSLRFSINLSGASINDRSMLPFIREQFALHGIPCHIVCFEITETAAIGNLGQANEFIHVLRRDGCKFSLDDFGSGMSSFSYLKSLSVDYLKIDGTFVKNIVSDPIDYAMVESIQNIGRVMGIATIAEFVENDAILQKLRTIGVDYAQGYGIAKPVPLETILAEECAAAA